MRSYAFKRDANFWQPGVKYSGGSNGTAGLLSFSLLIGQATIFLLLSVWVLGVLTNPPKIWMVRCPKSPVVGKGLFAQKLALNN